MKSYNFAFAGAGLAGLSLANRLAHSKLPGRSMLIVDRDLDQSPTHDFAFWTGRSLPFIQLARRSWNRMLVAGAQQQRVYNLAPYHYSLISGAAFHRYAMERLRALPNVDFVQGNVERVRDSEAGARLSVNGQEYAARWLFDSRFSPPPDFVPDSRRYRAVRLYSAGWEISTQQDSFDPQTPTLLDLRTPQQGNLRFMRVLPTSTRQALVEYMVYRTEPVAAAEQDAALADYIGGVLGCRDYEIVARQGGVRLLTDYPFPRRLGNYTMSIGVAGGMLKPSSGYAFTRVQRDSAAIARSLARYGHPFAVPPSALRFRQADSLVLRLLADHGERAGSLLAAAIGWVSPPRVLRFLDERVTPL